MGYKMEIIFKITGSLCITVYILGLLSNLVNINYTHRAIKLTFALFLITNVFLPLKNTTIDFTDLKLNEEVNTVDLSDKIIDAATDSMEKNLKSILDTNNVTYSDLSVHINNQEDGVYVDYIRVYGADTENYSYIRSLLKNEGQVIFGD